MQVHNLEPISDVDNIEVTPNSEDNESNVPIVDDYDLPIAIRKGVRKCTQQLAYPLSHFVSYQKLSSGYKSIIIIFYLSQYYYYPKNYL